MRALEDLDGVTAVRGVATADGCILVLFAASGFSGDAYFPAESITLTSLSAIAALREMCENLIEAHLELSQETEA